MSKLGNGLVTRWGSRPAPQEHPSRRQVQGLVVEVHHHKRAAIEIGEG
jgi:hypothetical protein